MRGVWCVLWCGLLCSALLCSALLYSTIINRHFLHVLFFKICAGRASETDDALWLGGLLVHGMGRRWDGMVWHRVRRNGTEQSGERGCM